MSEAFRREEGAAPPVRPRRTPSRRPRALLPTLAIVVVLVVLSSFFVEIWTSQLWFQSLGFGAVFSTILWTRVVLFVVFGLVLRGSHGRQRGAGVPDAADPDRRRLPQPHRRALPGRVDPIRHWIVVGLGC